MGVSEISFRLVDGIYEIKCTVCKKPFSWEPPNPVEISSIMAKLNRAALPPPVTFSKTCPNRIDPPGVSPYDCLTQWSIEYDLNNNQITRVRSSSSPTTDKIWIEFAIKRAVEGLDRLDKRAEFFLTTIATLIAIKFGLFVAFTTSLTTTNPLNPNIYPQFILAISAIFFALSYFPYKKLVYLESPKNIEDAYTAWHGWKVRWQIVGFIFFIIGLFAIAYSFIELSPVQEIQNVAVQGNLTLIQ